jgi:hypothetical protein
MRYDNAAAGHIGRDFPQTSRHVFIGEPVKPVSPDTLDIKALWNGEAIG